RDAAGDPGLGQVLAGRWICDQLEQGAPETRVMGAIAKGGQPAQMAQIQLAQAANLGAGADGQVVTALPNSGYPANGEWSVQLGETGIVGELGGHQFINLVDPEGKVRLQIHGFQVDRADGSLQLNEFGRDAQLKAFAFTGDKYGAADRVLHPPVPLGLGSDPNLPPQQLIQELAQTADTINSRNIDYYPIAIPGTDPPRFFAESQNSNSVINTMGDVIRKYAPDFRNDNEITYFHTPGDDRNLTGPLLERDPDNRLAPAPIGEIPPFSMENGRQWAEYVSGVGKSGPMGAPKDPDYPPGISPLQPATYDDWTGRPSGAPRMGNDR
ncbi:MAG: hypothetical protein AAF556_04590, partial [Pseudomonadota bacterium]